MDDIVIWSCTIEEHTKNITTILQALLDHKLYLNLKKSKLFCSEICFLGHCISAKGVEADEGKADHITNWPVPSCAKHVTFGLNVRLDLSGKATTESLRTLGTKLLLKILGKGSWSVAIWMIRGDEGVGAFPGVLGGSGESSEFCATSSIVTRTQT